MSLTVHGRAAPGLAPAAPLKPLSSLRLGGSGLLLPRNVQVRHLDYVSELIGAAALGAGFVDPGRVRSRLAALRNAVVNGSLLQPVGLEPTTGLPIPHLLELDVSSPDGFDGAHDAITGASLTTHDTRTGKGERRFEVADEAIQVPTLLRRTSVTIEQMGAGGRGAMVALDRQGRPVLPSELHQKLSIHQESSLPELANVLDHNFGGRAKSGITEMSRGTIGPFWVAHPGMELPPDIAELLRQEPGMIGVFDLDVWRKGERDDGFVKLLALRPQRSDAALLAAHNGWKPVDSRRTVVTTSKRLAYIIQELGLLDAPGRTVTVRSSR